MALAHLSLPSSPPDLASSRRSLPDLLAFCLCSALVLPEAEALAEACEGRGVSAVLAIVDAREQEIVRRPALKALARLASKSQKTLLEVGTEENVFTDRRWDGFRSLKAGQ